MSEGTKGKREGEGEWEMEPRELRDRLDEAVPVRLLDVREDFEREIADLPEHGQVRIPVGELEGRAAELDPSAELVVYCRSGSRSRWAAEELRRKGFSRVWNLRGGLLAWRDEVDPEMETY